MGLKDFSRLDQAVTDNVSLNDCIESALLIARNTLKYKVEVLKRLEDLPYIRCTASQINQVLLNLFTNAAQAIEDKGYLLIKTWTDEQQVYVSVQDTGKALHHSISPKYLTPFLPLNLLAKAQDWVCLFLTKLFSNMAAPFGWSHKLAKAHVL